MPSVDPTALRARDVIPTTTRRGQASGASSSRATHRPSRSDSVPKPPTMDRPAEPEPRRAHSERASRSSPSPRALSMAVTRAAKPEADDARPQPAGKLLALVTARGGMSNSERSTCRKASILRSATGAPSRTIRSASATWTVVAVVSASRVTDREGVAGTLPGPGRFPQYFTSAMLGWAVAVARAGIDGSCFPVSGRGAGPWVRGDHSIGGRGAMLRTVAEVL